MVEGGEGVVTEQGIQAHLNHLAQRKILRAYLDPLQTVLDGNEVLHRTMPRLDKADHNVMRWMLTRHP
ncbi:hypothetical protein AB0F85_01395 [Nocardia fluminea]|uniref:hypothetical protein n=1 Tax=Nocardia fluminea TaxID=134984 RepID=UPI0033EA326B